MLVVALISLAMSPFKRDSDDSGSLLVGAVSAALLGICIVFAGVWP